MVPSTIYVALPISNWVLLVCYAVGKDEVSIGLVQLSTNRPPSITGPIENQLAGIRQSDSAKASALSHISDVIFQLSLLSKCGILLSLIHSLLS